MNFKAKRDIFRGNYICKSDLYYTYNYFFANKNYFLRTP